jgi:hypothetical protein
MSGVFIEHFKFITSQFLHGKERIKSTPQRSAFFVAARFSALLHYNKTGISGPLPHKNERLRGAYIGVEGAKTDFGAISPVNGK